MTFGEKDFLPVEPQSGLSFLILLGRTKVRLKPLLLELYPSSSDELVRGPFSELRFGVHPRTFRFDKIKSPGV